MCRSPLSSLNTSDPSGRAHRTFGGSFGSSGLWGGASVDRAFSGASHRCWIKWGSGEFGGQLDTFGSFFTLLEPFVFTVWYRALSCWGSAIAMRGCVWSAIVLEWRVQSNIHMVSQQNIALEQGDQCYSVRLSVVLILWLIDGACHLRHDIILNVENFKRRLRVLAVLNANFLQIFRPVVFTWTLEPLRKQQITLWFREAFLMLHPNGRGHVWAARAPRCRLSSKEFSRHHKDYFAR